MDELTVRERFIMSIIWKNRQDISLQELIKKVGDEEKVLHRNTICAFIEQLIKKGFVSTYHVERKCYIHSIYSIEDMVERIVWASADYYFDGNIEMVKQMVNKVGK